MFSKFFIYRPVFASVLSIAIVLFGLAAMLTLPVAQYPEILPPEVMVQAIYPGATAETIAETVAAPLEQAINGVDGMLYITTSTSDAGMMMLDVAFKVGTDPDKNMINVNNRVQEALSSLPDSVRNLGVSVFKRSSSIMGIGSIYSPSGQYDAAYLSNYALVNVIDELKRTDGVGDASMFGKFNYSMRVWVNPGKLADYGLTSTDIAAAISEQNRQFTGGSIGASPAASDEINAFTYAITSQGRLITPKEFGEIILRSNPDGSVLHLSDVARVELGTQMYGIVGALNGLPAANIGIYIQPGANAVATAKAVRKTMERVSKSFPAGVAFKIPFDTTKFVSIAIDEVVKTFAAALALVLLVVYLFLQNIRATIIPMIAVPVSIIGTFAGMMVLGFTINLMTLFGLILAIGIVVDDAIVVLENTERIMRTTGMNSYDAAVESMREVTSPVVAIVLVLCAVFVPVAFIEGLSGKMYQQFAITIAISVVISGFVALTLTPALCAIVFKHVDVNHKPAKPFQIFNTWFAKLTNAYLNGARYFYSHNALGVGIFLAVIALAAVLWTRVPSSLVPDEDQGYLMTLQYLPPGASLERTQKVVEPWSDILTQNPNVEDVVSIAGLDVTTLSLRSHAGAGFIALKDWSERTRADQSSANLANQLTGIGWMAFPDALVFVANPPPISGLSITGGFSGFIQNRGSATPEEISDVAQKFLAEVATRPEINKSSLRSSFTAMTPRYRFDIDREKARSMGVSISDISTTLQSNFGALYVNDFTLFGRNYQVNMQADSQFRNSPEDLSGIFVRSKSGQLVPIYSLVTFHRTVGADIVQRFNLFNSAPFDGSPAPGYSSGQALNAVEEVAATSLPKDYSIAWTGTAFQEKSTGNTALLAFAFGIVMVFLILAAQYERWSLPFAVITAIPFGAFGAILLVWLRGMERNIYFEISLLVLIGLAAKNAILIVEFAVQLRDKGMTRRDAAIEAAKLRFRPIIMTSMAFVLGCMPLAISTGAGAASRKAIGTGVVGGMLAATFLAVFFVPMFYRMIDRIGYKNPDALPASAAASPAAKAAGAKEGKHNA